MILKSIRVENYRSIKDEILYCDDLTVLVGTNGSGKSSFLRAVVLFSAEKPGITNEDYYNRQTGNAIRITATFKNLPDSAMAQFGEYILNGELTVIRVFEWDNDKCKPTYYGTRLQNPDFAPIYAQKKGARLIYENLLKKDDYKDFHEWSNYEEVTDFLRKWDVDNPDKLERIQDDGKFFTHGKGFPSRFARFLYIEPVRDSAKDGQEEKNSTLAQLMDVAVRNSIMTNDRIRTFKEDAQRTYNELMRLSEQKELGNLGNSMTKTISNFVPNVRVDLSWSSTELDIGPPKAEIKLVEDEYQSAVSGAGHGLQRIFTMSILQHLSEAQADMGGESTAELPVLVLVIDEPELYQHPNRQRHMSQVLLSLANRGISGAAREMQIIYSTHSPHFVGIDRLNQIRLVRKVADGSGPKTTRIWSTSINDVANDLSAIPKHRRETADELARRLQIIMTPIINEGFFADVIVLVEGESDRAALTAVANAAGYSLERRGISVIPCGGKGNLSDPAMVFRRLGIPLYVIWDIDLGKKSERLNSVLLLVMGQPSGSLLAIRDTFACLDDNMGDTIKKDLNGKFLAYRQKCANDLDIDDEDDVVKKPYSVSHMIKTAAREGCTFPTLEGIVQKAIKLCPERAVT